VSLPLLILDVTLISDLQVHCVWQPEVDVLFNVRVVDTDAPSYHGHSPQAVLSSAETEKKHNYTEACLVHHAGFTLLCFLVYGMFVTEADFFLCRLADCLSAKCERSYSAVIGWVRSGLSFAVLHVTMLCVRGS